METSVLLKLQINEPLTELITKIGILKTVELLNQISKQVHYFEPQHAQATSEKIHSFVLFSLSQHARITENEFIRSRKHYHSDLRKLAFVILFKNGIRITEIASFYIRDTRFVKSSIDETMYLLEKKYIENEFLELYERINQQLSIYDNIIA